MKNFIFLVNKLEIVRNLKSELIMLIKNKKHEGEMQMNKFKNREELLSHQNKELLKTIKYVYENIPYYRKKMKEKGVKLEDIKSIEDLKKLPFTTKSDLRENYPFNTFGKPLSEIVRIHASSGTTGKPTVVGYTKQDIINWADINKRNLENIGVTKKDVIQVSYGYGLFTGGLGMHYGIENLGATVIPMSTGNTQKQIMLLQDFKATGICCTPSYILFLYDTMIKQGINPKSLNLRFGIFGAEPWTLEMRKDIEKKLGIKAYDIYGLSEIMGPGVGLECIKQNGLHINEDFFIMEIIDSETGEVKPDGEKGELVITTIGKDGIPMIRYRTKDITLIIPEECSCGNIFKRIKRLEGRVDDMLIIKGVNIFPSQIESVILEFEKVLPFYQIVVDRINNVDIFDIEVETTLNLPKDREILLNKIKSRLNSVLGINPNIILIPEGSLKRVEGKSVRVIDKRNL